MKIQCSEKTKDIIELHRPDTFTFQRSSIFESKVGKNKFWSHLLFLNLFFQSLFVNIRFCEQCFIPNII